MIVQRTIWRCRAVWIVLFSVVSSGATTHAISQASATAEYGPLAIQPAGNFEWASYPPYIVPSDNMGVSVAAMPGYGSTERKYTDMFWGSYGGPTCYFDDYVRFEVPYSITVSAKAQAGGAADNFSHADAGAWVTLRLVLDGGWPWQWGPPDPSKYNPTSPFVWEQLSPPVNLPTGMGLQVEAQSGQSVSDTRSGTLSIDNMVNGKIVIGSAHVVVGWDVMADADSPRAPQDTYGVFVGTHDPCGVQIPHFRGDKVAKDLRSTVMTSLGLKDSRLLEADLTKGESVSMSQIATEIASMNMQPGDRLLLYIGAHGNSESGGPEITLSPGDEWLRLGPQTKVTDDDLALALAGIPNSDSIEKWVMLDACHSGGFWLSGTANDDGDLFEKLDNVGLFAACPEDGIAHYQLNGRPFFGEALIDAFTPIGGRPQADTTPMTPLTFDDLTTWVKAWGQNLDSPQSAYEQGFGDPVVWSSDLWNPVSFTSPDFVGSITYSSSAPVPAPGALALCGIGLGVIHWLRGRRAL